jgi:hypothetical protein
MGYCKFLLFWLIFIGLVLFESLIRLVGGFLVSLICMRKTDL